MKTLTLPQVLLGLLPITLPLLSPAQAKPAWKTTPGGTVAWMRTTSTGNLLVCTNEGLKGLDPATGNVNWTVKQLANAPESGYTEITGTPFISLVPGGAADQLVILEPFSGKTLFSSAESGLSHIADTYFLYANNAIILVGQQPDKRAVMACVDMGSGHVRWTKEDAFSKLTSCASAGKDAILVGTLFFAYKLDANTGAELWKQSPDPKFAAMAGLMGVLDKGGANLKGAASEVPGIFITTPYAPGLCFMGMQQTKQTEKTDSQGKKTTETTYSTFINAFRVSDGGYAWAKPLQLQQQLGTFVPLKQGLLIGGGANNHVDMLDYTTGEGLWGKNGKGINASGPLTGAVEVDGKTLITSGTKNSAAMLVDGHGEEVWKKKVKLDGAIGSVTVLPNSLVIASGEQTEVVDIASGNSRLDKTFQGGAGTVASGPDGTFLFNNRDHLLYRIPSGGDAVTTVSSAPLEFGGKEEADHVEVAANGILVSSDQNLALFGMDGGLKYNRYFPAPRESGLTRALLYANAVRAAYYTAAFGYTSAAFGAASQSIQVNDAGSAMGKAITGQVSQLYGDASAAALDYTKQFLARANARFKATESTNSVQYILSDAGKREYVLMRVNKQDGSLGETIPLGHDKTPMYAVDDIDNTVYLVSGTDVLAYR